MAGGIAPLSSSNPPSNQKFIGKSHILGPKWLHLPTLTVGLLGVQIFWSVEMGYASPYLLSLGLSKSSIAMVFLAGPISGLIMQPIIGILADTTTSKYGRRRPWMLAGTVLTVLAMLLLGYTRAFASIFTGWNNPSNDRLTVGLAILAIFLVDFSINAVMAVDRALIVDTLPPARQTDANAWAARMLSVGSLTGFFVGSIHLTEMFPFLGNTQLQILSVMVSVLLLGGHVLACVCVKEKVLVKDQRRVHSGSILNHPAVREVREMWSTVTRLPKTVQLIFAVQFFCQMAWFPLGFYGTLYVGEIYKSSNSLSAEATAAEVAARDAEGARLGSRALFFSGLLALITTLILPFFVKSADASIKKRNSFFSNRLFKSSLPWLWTFGNFSVSMCVFAVSFCDSIFWVTVSIGLTGVAGAIGAWAPYALLGEAILGHGANASEDLHMTDTGLQREEQEGLLASDDADEEKFIPSEKPTQLSGKAGIILGLHNVFIVIPQFIISGVSALVFAIFDSPSQQNAQPDTNRHSPNSLKYVYRLGGTLAFVAFIICWRLSKHLQKR